mgnify:CR=1 FL=1
MNEETRDEFLELMTATGLDEYAQAINELLQYHKATDPEVVDYMDRLAFRLSEQEVKLTHPEPQMSQ